MTKHQTHELLVESKTRICELDDSVGKLKDKCRALEEDKGQLSVDLENARMMVNDAEMKCRMVEREIGSGSKSSRSQEAAMVKQMTDRHNGQIEMLQQQIDNFRNKLETRDMELRTLDAKYMELQKGRELLLVEQSTRVNELTAQLEKAQRQVQKLLAQQNEQRLSPRTEEENAQLRIKICSLEGQIADLQKTKENFANVMESTPHMRKKPHLGMQGLEETDALVREVATLKREVFEKGLEIKSLIMTENDLRERLSEKEEQAKNTDSSEECSGCEVMRRQVEELMSLNQNINEANAELQKMNQRIAETQAEDNRMVVQKLQELKVLQQMIASQEEQIKGMERDKQALLEKVQHERRMMKEVSVNSLKCMQQMRTATDMEVKNMQLQNDCMGYLKNLKGLRAASQLLDGVTVSRVESTEDSSAGSKQTSCDVMVSTPSDGSGTASTETTTATEMMTSPQRTAIIEEYAKLTAVEIKRVEQQFRKQLVSTQEELAESQRALEALQRQKVSDTQLFKEVILAEREEYEGLLTEKEEQVRGLEKRISDLEGKSARTEREEELLDSLERELKKKQEEVDEERHSMQVWRNQWKEERRQLLAIEEHLKKEIAELRENWRSAKSTAANYKKYSEEKDKFVNREIDRMRMQYEGVIEKLRVRSKDKKKKDQEQKSA